MDESCPPACGALVRLGSRRLRGRVITYDLWRQFALCEVEREAGHCAGRGYRIRVEYWPVGEIRPGRHEPRGRLVRNKVSPPAPWIERRASAAVIEMRRGASEDSDESSSKTVVSAPERAAA